MNCSVFFLMCFCASFFFLFVVVLVLITWYDATAASGVTGGAQ